MSIDGIAKGRSRRESRMYDMQDLAWCFVLIAVVGPTGSAWQLPPEQPFNQNGHIIAEPMLKGGRLRVLPTFAVVPEIRSRLCAVHFWFYA